MGSIASEIPRPTKKCTGIIYEIEYNYIVILKFFWNYFVFDNVDVKTFIKKFGFLSKRFDLLTCQQDYTLNDFKIVIKLSKNIKKSE